MFSVIVIDDSLSMRKVIKDMINSIDEFEVIAEAVDAYDAREKIKKYEPDLVTIDLNMPKMDGASFLRNLMRLHPMPAVVISGESVRGSDIFDDGAVGFIPKPELDESMSSFGKRVQESLLNLTFLLERYTLKKPKPEVVIHSNEKNVDTGLDQKKHPDEILQKNPALFPGQRLVAIGSSTGGVESLIKVFSKLKKDLPPILITQHIPYGFSNSFAQRLNACSEVEVCEAKDGMLIQQSCAYLAPGNMHMLVEKVGTEYRIKLLDAVRISRHKPSVDILFRSVNNTVGASAMAVMMTGMGDDGSIGMKELHDNGAYTVAQDEKSCVVFGMPKKAIEIGAVKTIVSLDDIAETIINFSKNIRK